MWLILKSCHLYIFHIMAHWVLLIIHGQMEDNWLEHDYLFMLQWKFLCFNIIPHWIPTQYQPANSSTWKHRCANVTLECEALLIDCYPQQNSFIEISCLSVQCLNSFFVLWHPLMSALMYIIISLLFYKMEKNSDNKGMMLLDWHWWAVRVNQWQKCTAWIHILCMHRACWVQGRQSVAGTDLSPTAVPTDTPAK